MRLTPQLAVLVGGPLLIAELAAATAYTSTGGNSSGGGEGDENRRSALRGGDDGQQQQRRRLPVFNIVQGGLQGMLDVIDSTTVDYVGDCTDDDTCGLCQGDCDSDDDCLGSLRCYERDFPGQTVPGCIGADLEDETYDICYMPPSDAGPAVNANGGSGLCEGDCDDDGDCDDGLECYQRNYGYTDIPGCFGGMFDTSRNDFCYRPPPTPKDEVTVVGCSSDNPCPRCRGDCDDDSDCEGDLKCLFREEIYMPVPGCRNGHNFADPIDFCYDPKDDIVVREIGCDSDEPCDKCRGDCDDDEDCMPGLLCFQRDIPYQLVPGCTMGADQSTDDYCYDPGDEEDQDEGGSSEPPDKDDWPDYYFDYDLNDEEYGPAGFRNVDVDDNEWETYDLDVDDNECDGDEQSPIDLNTVNAACEETHHIYYLQGDEEIMNSRGLIEYAVTPFRLRVNFEKVSGVDPPQIDPPGGIAGGITAKDAVHAEYMEPSEHTIGGKRFDGEYRIMHAQDGYDTIIGVAVMVESGHPHNHHWEVILGKWERVDDCGNGNGRNFDMKNLEFYYPITSMYFWGYYGSLTQPPCTQIVQWRVIDTPIRISNEQKERTRRLLNEGGPCRDHPLRKSPRQNGGARPIQRNADDAKVWRCTIDNYDQE